MIYIWVKSKLTLILSFNDRMYLFCSFTGQVRGECQAAWKFMSSYSYKKMTRLSHSFLSILAT